MKARVCQLEILSFFFDISTALAAFRLNTKATGSISPMDVLSSLPHRPLMQKAMAGNPFPRCHNARKRSIFSIRKFDYVTHYTVPFLALYHSSTSLNEMSSPIDKYS